MQVRNGFQMNEMTLLYLSCSLTDLVDFSKVEKTEESKSIQNKSQKL